ncbi:4-hydroxybenzoyl-CoA thioesterase [Fibrobacteres bacterium R8-0-B4]
MKKINELTIRVYYEDTDCGNVVYYANYLRYMERGRTELLRDLGVELSVYHADGFAFAVAEANVKYKQSAHYNDLLTVTTSVKEVTSATMTFCTEVSRGGTLLAVGEIKAACVNLANGRPARLPAEIAEALKSAIH